MLSQCWFAGNFPTKHWDYHRKWRVYQRSGLQQNKLGTKSRVPPIKIGRSLLNSWNCPIWLCLKVMYHKVQYLKFPHFLKQNRKKNGGNPPFLDTPTSYSCYYPSRSSHFHGWHPSLFSWLKAIQSPYLLGVQFHVRKWLMQATTVVCRDDIPVTWGLLHVIPRAITVSKESKSPNCSHKYPAW